MATRVEHSFSYNEPSEAKIEKYKQIREKGAEFASLIESLCPDGREQSIAFTKIEEAVMWANNSLQKRRDE